MRFGKPGIITCPGCGKRFRVSTLLSGNSGGMRAWSDGYCHYPMLPGAEEFSVCNACGFLFWVTMDHLGDDSVLPLSSEPLEYLPVPSPADCYLVLEKGQKFSDSEEKKIRLRAWWTENHRFRQFESRGCLIPAIFMALVNLVVFFVTGRLVWRLVSLLALCVAGAFGWLFLDELWKRFWESKLRATQKMDKYNSNLRRLLELLSRDIPEEKLYAAEALRLLGEFQPSIELCKTNAKQRLLPFFEAIQGAAARECRDLQEIDVTKIPDREPPQFATFTFLRTRPSQQATWSERFPKSQPAVEIFLRNLATEFRIDRDLISCISPDDCFEDFCSEYNQDSRSRGEAVKDAERLYAEAKTRFGISFQIPRSEILIEPASTMGEIFTLIETKLAHRKIPDKKNYMISGAILFIKIILVWLVVSAILRMVFYG